MPVLYEKRDHVVYITLDGDTALNPITTDMSRQLYESFQNYRDDPDLRVAILTSTGDVAFSAGGNLKGHWENRQRQFSPEGIRERFWYPYSLPRIGGGPYVWDMCLMEQYKPVIAAIKGYCLGAGLITTLAMADIRVASEDAQFGLSEIQRGLGGGVFALTRLQYQIPYAMAMELILTGDRISAPDALRMGLVNRVVPTDQVLSVAEEYATRILENSPLAVRASKEVFLRAMEEPSRHNLARLTNAIASLQRQSQDTLEGETAWHEKRKPVYTGT